MARRNPPDHRGPDAVAGLSKRLAAKDAPPIPITDLGEGQRRLDVKVEVERLKTLSFAELRDEALELGLGDASTRRAIERCDLTVLRLAILEKKLDTALGGES